jgi:protein phosphatase
MRCSDGVNDGEADTVRLAALVRGMNCHVNLIPANTVAQSPYRRSPRAAQFLKKLQTLGVNVTMRRELGTDIAAACGQLRRQTERGNHPVKAIGDTHIGMVRSANQDCFRIGSLFGQTRYVVVCDGMGGKNGGGIASRMAADSIETALLRAASGGMLPETSLRAALLCAVQGANSVVYEYAQQSPDLTGMGTTVIAAAVRSGLVCAAYAGDSRIYSVLEERLIQLTRDHTVVQVLLEKGEISPEDAKHHPQRHYITRALGSPPSWTPTTSNTF